MSCLACVIFNFHAKFDKILLTSNDMHMGHFDLILNLLLFLGLYIEKRAGRPGGKNGKTVVVTK